MSFRMDERQAGTRRQGFGTYVSSLRGLLSKSLQAKWSVSAIDNIE